MRKSNKTHGCAWGLPYLYRLGVRKTIPAFGQKITDQTTAFGRFRDKSQTGERSLDAYISNEGRGGRKGKVGKNWTRNLGRKAGRILG